MAHYLEPRRITYQTTNLCGNTVDIFWIHEDSVDTIVNDLRYSAMAATKHRLGGMPRLYVRQAKSFNVSAFLS